MIRLINVLTDGAMTAKKVNDVIGDMPQITFKYDNKTYTYEYDSAEEMANEIAERYTDEEETPLFLIENGIIKDIDKIREEDLTKDDMELYKNYSVLFNGFMPLEDYIKTLEV